MKQKEELEQKLRKTEDKRNAREQSKEETELDELIEKFLELEPMDKIYLYRLIHRIEIDKDKNVYVYFNFSKLNFMKENQEDFIKMEELIGKNL